MQSIRWERHFTRKHYQVSGANSVAEINLGEMKTIKAKKGEKDYEPMPFPFFIVLVDLFLSMVYARALPDKSNETQIDNLKKILGKAGNFEIVHGDFGFNSPAFNDLFLERNIHFSVKPIVNLLKTLPNCVERVKKMT